MQDQVKVPPGVLAGTVTGEPTRGWIALRETCGAALSKREEHTQKQAPRLGQRAGPTRRPPARRGATSLPRGTAPALTQLIALLSRLGSIADEIPTLLPLRGVRSPASATPSISPPHAEPHPVIPALQRFAAAFRVSRSPRYVLRFSKGCLRISQSPSTNVCDIGLT